ncbi:FAD-dependent oxidoreductase [Streptomyces sp. NPDC048106]|uniref:FAD-dependent oxidoreductase n=1 Tax=Streptomyces sp. NPDC048106 TaxID=3155750 RepID=UPI003451DD87
MSDTWAEENVRDGGPVSVSVLRPAAFTAVEARPGAVPALAAGEERALPREWWLVRGRGVLMARTFDAVVIGSGVNGLVAAAQLAKGGWSVALIEGSDRLGGFIATEEPATCMTRTPRGTRCSCPAGPTPPWGRTCTGTVWSTATPTD